MKAVSPYRLSVNLKLALIAGAVIIAVASLAYTNHLVERLREKERVAIQLWARAVEHMYTLPTPNPYREQLTYLEEYFAGNVSGNDAFAGLSSAEVDSIREAIQWSQRMPPADELGFVVDEIVVPNLFEVPAIVTGQSASGRDTVLASRNVEIDSTWSDARRQAYLRERIAEMDRAHDPITIEKYGLQQTVHYGESALVQHLRVFPYVQLFFVALFMIVGYLGFSYVRKSEQSNLWVGMAKEAAHQLGTPLSSMMGWLAILKNGDDVPAHVDEAVEELEKDVGRLQRVANRFSTIGSEPKLTPTPLKPVIEGVGAYIRRRIPRDGQQISLDVHVPAELEPPINAELFEWVIENLLKNALDAIEDDTGHVEVEAWKKNDNVYIDVRDTGKGIDKRQWKNIFRPGYSTKKRGWGLGLSLAKRVVEEYHGGRLLILSSRPGEGTTFQITLDGTV
jgi:signal transduction histidine kinase